VCRVVRLGCFSGFVPLASAWLCVLCVRVMANRFYSFGGTSPRTELARAPCPGPGDVGNGGLSAYCPGNGYMYNCPGEWRAHFASLFHTHTHTR
jgi:hypothetical protein